MSQIQHLMARLIVAAVVVMAGIISPPAWAQEAQRDITPDQFNDALGSRRELPVDPVVLTPVAWSVVSTPVYPVRGTDGRIHLAYEMLFTNLSTAPARLQSIEVVDPLRDNRVVGASQARCGV